jgi:hypothetical protein
MNHFQTANVLAEPFHPCFYVDLPPRSMKRRNDAFMTWHLLTTMVLEKLLLSDYGLEVVTSVMWTPVISSQGSLSQDRFAIGTIGHKTYTDILPELLFATPRPSPCIFALNGYMYRFCPLMYSPRTPPSFPLVGVELALVRGETLTLDFIRDLLGNMGIPSQEILDIAYQQDQIGILCSSPPSAAVILQCARSYQTLGDEWNIVLNSKCVLPETDLPSYTASSAEQPEGPYPAAIVDPVLIRGRISPLSALRKTPPVVTSNLPAPQKVRPGVIVSEVKMLSRPSTATSVISSAMQKLSVSAARDPSPKKRRMDDQEITMWLDTLSGDTPLTSAQVTQLSNVVRSRLSTSADFLQAVIQMVPQAVETSYMHSGNSSMAIDEDS